MTFRISAQTIWETSKIHGVQYHDILMGLLGISPEVIERVVIECEEYDKTVTYPHRIVAGGKVIIIEEDGTQHEE